MRALERSGCPTAVVVTDAFVEEARVQRMALGIPSLEPVVITHPLSTLSDEEIAVRAAEAVDQVERLLTRGDSPT